MNTSQPLVCFGSTPVSRCQYRAVGLLDLLLREADALQFRAGQRIQREHEPAGVFNFASHRRSARRWNSPPATGCGRGRAEFPAPAFACGKNFGDMNTRPSETCGAGSCAPQVLRPFAQAVFVQTARPVRRDGKFVVHNFTSTMPQLFRPTKFLSPAGVRARRRNFLPFTRTSAASGRVL